jgi:hypothetical protein
VAGAGGVWAAAFGAAGCFLAAATAGAAGFGDGVGVAAAGAGCRGADAVAGSAVMMLTGGVEEALGNSALVGLPVGTPGMSGAIAATAGAAAGGAFQSGEYRAIIAS